MTAEQHTSIAHSDGDTPRVDEIDPDLEAYKRAYVMAINYSTGNFGEKFREVEQRLNRRLARTTPDQIRAAVYANCLGSSEVDDITNAVIALFDAEVKL